MFGKEKCSKMVEGLNAQDLKNLKMANTAPRLDRRKTPQAKNTFFSNITDGAERLTTAVRVP